MVPADSTVALAGHSGAGKTTCASLLLRHWDPTGGTVRIGGHPLRTLPLTRIRQLIAAVPQETYLFNLSIRDNIRLARPDATDTEVEDAAPAGERGTHLSGGQRQRIAIARALLTGAPILVLDEAVSSLDAESEAEVDRAMRTARTGRTTLIVAHPPSTLRTADTVVLLEEGRIVDTGPHDKLLARCPAYRRLLNEGA
ncbi:ABC transporter ATP-binding protein [Streptomyces prasinosporus]